MATTARTSISRFPQQSWTSTAKYRPTPLFRASALERALGYRGTILYKREDLNPTGSHKPNTAIPQAHYARRQGVTHLVTDTGAGQWGTSLAWACRNAGVACTVFMLRNSMRGKPYRRALMELAGARVYPSPSSITRRGRDLLLQNPEHGGSLGIGMGEAVEFASRTPGARLALGCMSYYAALHQTVVGRELEQQLDRAGEKADVLVACVGGGTNLFGFAAPWFERKLRGEPAPRIVAAESAAVPALTAGEYRYDYADTFGLTPKVLMFTLGHEFLPPPMHSGGLRYHGKSPILSLMKRLGHLEAVAVAQEHALRACRLFFECEGVLCAPETGHAIAAVIQNVRDAQAAGDTPTIVFCLSGTGYLDLEAYGQVKDDPAEHTAPELDHVSPVAGP